ncbi:MAG: hypothetical protein HY547_10390 [Elusimicrobia bacterium]|nr:hypothetical protein [Elusimicrobiota bacterium]
MKKIIACWTALALTPVAVIAEKVTVTSQYPSPLGVYKNLRVTANSYLAINSGSGVGIGTTLPTSGSKLDLYDANSATYGLKITMSGSGEHYGIYSSVSGGGGNQWAFYGADGDIYVNDGVRIGAETGDSSDNLKLYVSRSCLGTCAGEGYAVWASMSGYETNWAFYGLGNAYVKDSVSIGTTNTGAKLVVRQDEADDILKIKDADTTVFMVEDGGNVGIGTTNPAYNLHLYDESSEQYAFFINRKGPSSGGPKTFNGGYVVTDPQSGADSAIAFTASARGAVTAKGILADSDEGTNGYGVYATADNATNGYGVYAEAAGDSSSDKSFGVYGWGKGADYNHGVYAMASGSGDSNYAFYAEAAGASNNYGLYVKSGVVKIGGCSNDNWVDGGDYIYCQDIAEVYRAGEPMEPGDVVVLRGAENQLWKSRQPYEEGLAGVYSTAPGIILGPDEKEEPGITLGLGHKMKKGDFPLALAGRVLVKITNDGGPVVPGDRLTSSSKPGFAMKAIRSGQVLGMALSPFSGKEGQIQMMVNPQWWDGGEVAKLSETVSRLRDDNESLKLRLDKLEKKLAQK